MKNRKMLSLEQTMLPTNETAILYEDKILVMDNLDVPSGVEPVAGLQELSDRLPMKMSSACILIILSGTVKFGVNLRDFELTANCCAIISAGTIIERMDLDADTRFILLAFSPNDLPAAVRITQKNINRLYAMQVALLRLLPVHITLLRSTYSSLRVILTDPDIDTGKSETASSCINLLGSIIALGVDSHHEVVAKESRKDRIVAQFLQCVHENYREHRDLGFYADRLCLSLKYMSHVVFELTGRYPSKWIKDYVILDAKTMLRSGHYTVQQVADELNFPNQSFFGKYFKEAVGVSPKKWQ